MGDVTTVMDAAKELGVHFSTLYRWIEKGNVVYLRFGGIVFVPVAEIARLKKERNKKTASA